MAPPSTKHNAYFCIEKARLEMNQNGYVTAQAVKTFNCVSFPTCYGIEFTGRAIPKWAEQNDVAWHFH